MSENNEDDETEFELAGIDTEEEAPRHENDEPESLSSTAVKEEEEDPSRSKRYYKEKQHFDQEKERVMGQLPESYRNKLGTIGFAKWNKSTLPILILNPYHVPPHPVRDSWIKSFERLNDQGSLDKLPYLFYWYGTEQMDEAYGFLPPARVTLYAAAEKKKTHVLPPSIQRKLDKGSNLTENDQTCLRGYQEMSEDLNLDPSQRKRGVTDFIEDYEISEGEQEAEEEEEKVEIKKNKQGSKKKKKRQPNDDGDEVESSTKSSKGKKKKGKPTKKKEYDDDDDDEEEVQFNGAENETQTKKKRKNAKKKQSDDNDEEELEFNGADNETQTKKKRKIKSKDRKGKQKEHDILSDDATEEKPTNEKPKTKKKNRKSEKHEVEDEGTNMELEFLNGENDEKPQTKRGKQKSFGKKGKRKTQNEASGSDDEKEMAMIAEPPKKRKLSHTRTQSVSAGVHVELAPDTLKDDPAEEVEKAMAIEDMNEHDEDDADDDYDSSSDKEVSADVDLNEDDVDVLDSAGHQGTKSRKRKSEGGQVTSSKRKSTKKSTAPRDLFQKEYAAYNRSVKSFSGLIERWRKHLSADDTTALHRMVDEVMGLVDDFSVTFIEKFEVSKLLKDTKVQLRGKDESLDRCTALKDAFKESYQTRKKELPTGLKIDVPDKVKSEVPTKARAGPSKVDSTNSSRPEISKPTPHSLGKQPKEETPKPPIKKEEITMKRKKFSLTKMLRQNTAESIGSTSDKQGKKAPNSTVAASNTLPTWMTSSMTPAITFEKDPQRALGLEFLLEMANYFSSSSSSIDPKALALNMERAVYKSCPPQDEYWKKIHALIAGICGKIQPADLFHSIAAGRFESPDDLVALSDDQLATAYEGGTFHI